MGRDKLRKPRKERSSSRRSELAQVLEAFDRDSLWSLLLAAGRSPGTRTRWSTLGHIVAASANLGPPGLELATEQDLSRLLQLAVDDLPALLSLEDFVPEDPRKVVTVEAYGELYRLFGGNVERPVADIERALMLSELFDVHLVQKNGFGIRHLVEVALARIDAETWASESSWEKLGIDGEELTETLSHAELRVNVDWPKPWSAEHERALDWVTTAAAGLRHDPGSGVSVFGRTMRVILRGESEARWLPLAFMPEALAQGVAELASEIAGKAWARRRFAKSVARRIRRRLWRFNHAVIGPPDESDGPRIAPQELAQWAVAYGDRRLLAIHLVCDLDSRFRFKDEPASMMASRLLQGGRDDVGLPFVGGAKMSLKKGTQLIPVVVVSGSSHVMAAGPSGALHLSLEDLDWLAQSAEDEMDLFHFAHEMASSSADSFYWETINAWEAWREQGGAITRGVPPDAIYLEAHRGSAEWDRASRLSAVEKALHMLELPPLRAWDIVHERTDASPALAEWSSQESEYRPGRGHLRPPVRVINLHVSAVPVAFGFEDAPDAQSIDREFLFDLVGAYSYAMRAVDSAWTDALAGSPLRAMHFVFHSGEVDDISGFRIECLEPKRPVAKVDVQIDVSAALHRTELSSAAGQSLMAQIVLDALGMLGVPKSGLDGIRTHWMIAQPTLVVESVSPMVSRSNVPRPVEIEGPLVAATDRRLAKRIRDAGVKPGLYAPDVASQFDRTTLAPIARSELSDQLSSYRSDDLLRYGLLQLERILSQRNHQIGDVERGYGLLKGSGDPIEERRAIEAEFLRLRRSAELIVELSLIEPPNGSEPIDERSWAEILAASATYFDSITRSETLYHQLLESSLEVTELFELKILSEGGKFKAANFARSVALQALESSTTLEEASTEMATARMAAEEAFVSTEGTSISDMLVVLYALAVRPLGDHEEDAPCLQRDEVLRYLEGIPDLNVDSLRLSSALRCLTSTISNHQAENWQPWRLRSRRTRLVTRPLVTLSDGRIVVSPNLCLAAASILQVYWQAGQLPWSKTGSSALDEALAQVRQVKNLQLEQQVEEIIRSAGWAYAARIKAGDGQRIGVNNLSTEVDLVIGRSDSQTIWVLEVKDPVPVFAPPEIRRQLDRFFVGDKSYSSLLTRKLDEVTPCVASVATKLGLPAGEYEVRGLFVTRQETPAAHFDDKHHFITAGNLLEFLSTNASSTDIAI